jgi:glucosamine 6-phosphate synthetase-like amidotransferase/phosphosugar isomerase protein
MAIVITLCGIAGYSLSDSSRVDPTLATQILMAAISERGSDAAGYCYRGPDVALAIHKQRSGASRLLDSIRVPAKARQALVHVRDYTKGHPSLEANNHPIRHGSVVGIHNGIIKNDEEIFAEYGFERAAPRMTVDSEAIFALMELERSSAEALDRLYGSMASAWMDEREPEVMYLARGMGRPLWIGEGRNELFFASTKAALELVESYAGVSLVSREVSEGTLLSVDDGQLVATDPFRPDMAFTEEPLPSVRAPEEHRSCLALLASLAAPAVARAAAR